MTLVLKSAWFWFAHSFHESEWIAAYALLIQALIFFWQGRILRRHAATLEKHTDIASTQSKTAELIAEALKQQGTILSDQTKIMKEQFAFRKLLESHAERKTMLDLMVGLLTSVRLLAVKIETMPYSPEEVARISEMWVQMEMDATACRKTLVTCAHLTKDEWMYFSTYLKDVGDLKKTNDLTKDLNQLKALNEKYKEFVATMVKMMGFQSQWPAPVA